MDGGRATAQDPLAALSPYELRHLVIHLLEQGRLNDVHRLLRLNGSSDSADANAWYAAKERAGTEAEYLTELDVVLRAIRRDGHHGRQKESVAASLGMQVRYWLIGASLRTRRSSRPEEFLAALVSTGQWSWERAEADAANRPAPQERAAALTALIPLAQPTQKARASEKALRHIREIHDPAQRARALTTLAKFLDDPVPETVLMEASVIVRSIDSDSEQYPIGLAAIAALMPEPDRTKQMKAALGQAGCMEYGSWRVTALRSIAPLVSKPLLPHLLSVADRIEDESNRAEAIEAVSPYLTQPLLQTAIGNLRYMESEVWRAFALAALEPLLLEPGAALTAIRSGKYGKWKGHALGSIATRLPDDLLIEAHTELASLRDPNEWDFAAARLSPRLPDVSEALNTTLAIASRPHRQLALEFLASRLPELLLGRTLAEVAGWEGRDARRSALRTLAPHLSGPLLYRGLETCCAIKDGVEHARTIASLAPHLPESMRTAALSAALDALWTSDNSISRPYALHDLAAVLPGPLIVSARDRAGSVADEEARADLTNALAPYLPDIDEAVAATERVDNGWTRQDNVAALVGRQEHRVASRLFAMVISSIDGNSRTAIENLDALAPQLRPEQLREAIAATKAIQDRVDRAVAVLTVAAHLGSKERQQIAEREYYAMRDDKSFKWPARALAAAVPLLPASMREEAIRRAIAAARSSDNIFQVEELTACAMLFSERERQPYLEEAVTVLETLDGEWAAGALTELAPHLPQQLLGRALAVAEKLLQGDQPDAAVHGVSAIAPFLDSEPAPSRLAFVEAAIGVQGRDRDQMLRLVAALTPVLVSSGGAHLVAEIAEAIADATRWWP